MYNRVNSPQERKKLLMGIEYELKFRATPQAQAAIAQALEGEQAHYRMETTYYDTPSESLSSRHFTLRRRMENDRSVCTLKAPLDEHSRGEWETECDRVEDSIDMLCQLGAPKILSHLVQEGVIPICGAKFQRIAKTVVLEDCTVEVALDAGVLMGGGKELPLCEVEVELKSGTREAVQAYALALAALYGLRPERRSKFRRALALYKGEESENV